IKQEVLSSESDETDSDYADILKTYDPSKEYSDSEDDKESIKTEESKKEDPESPESDLDSK
ncbi:hypothetical protein A2U01_0066585, partial [Trifolium medium]|nr:hypothetical protein [Trifolium medium]